MVRFFRAVRPIGIAVILLAAFAGRGVVAAESAAAPRLFDSIPKIPGVGPTTSPTETAAVLKIIFLVTVLSLAPSILMLMTCFARVVIVLSFLRRALATQQLPPNQIIVGLSLFLTFAIMAPVFNQANNEALQPYLRGEMSQKEALGRAAQPFRRFMLDHARRKDLRLFVSLDRELSARARANDGRLASEDIPTLTLIPAFVLMSKLKLLNTYWSLLLPGIVSAGAIFMLTQFFKTIPRDLEEAALIDGASQVQIYKDVILPLARPALLTVFILQFQAMWNNFLTPLLYLDAPKMWVLNVALSVFKQQYKAQWNLTLVGAVFNAVPVLLLFFFFSKYYIEGVAYAGVKG